MRVLMVSWEYPPLVVGGLGRHVDALSRELARVGHEVCVLTRGEATSIVTESCDGVRVQRAAVDPIAVDFTTETLLSWSQATEHSMLRGGLALVRRWRPDVVHAHDWLVAQTGMTLSQFTGAPLVATMHATEAGRHQGRLPGPLNVAIHSIERWLAHNAARVITCSSSMREEVQHLYELAPQKVELVPNGIDPRQWTVSPAQRRAARARYAADGPLIVFAGRLVHEKGVQTLLDAMPGLRSRHRALRLVVAGSGPFESELQARARARRVARAVHWAGFVPDGELALLLAAADAVVVPSMYEPFGLVALEAAACGSALVLADTGGLSDLIAAGAAAAWFPPGDHDALATSLSAVLDDAHGRQRAVRAARRVITRDYSWPAVASHTAEIYAAAKHGA